MSRPIPPRVMTFLAGLALAFAGGLFLLPTPSSDAEADAETGAPEASAEKTEAPASQPAPADGEASIAAAPAPDETLVANFENGLESRFGAGWTETTDQRMGGSSVTNLEVAEGALVVSGEIKMGAMFPWAGAMVFLGSEPMGPVNLSSRTELHFRVRGDGRRYSAMLFSGDMQGIPPMQPFTADEDWKTITLPLGDFAGADLGTLRAVSWTAGNPAGIFRFEIDDVEIR